MRELLHVIDDEVLLRDVIVGDDHCDWYIADDAVHGRNGADGIALTHPDDPLLPADDHEATYCQHWLSTPIPHLCVCLVRRAR